MSKQKVYLVFAEVLEGNQTSVRVVGVFAEEAKAKACMDRKFNRWMESKVLIND